MKAWSRIPLRSRLLMLVGTIIWSLADWAPILNLRLTLSSIIEMAASVAPVIGVLIAIGIIFSATYVGVDPADNPDRKDGPREWTWVTIIGSSAIMTLGALALTLVTSKIVVLFGLFLTRTLVAQCLLLKAPQMKIAFRRYIEKQMRT